MPGKVTQETIGIWLAPEAHAMTATRLMEHQVSCSRRNQIATMVSRAEAMNTRSPLIVLVLMHEFTDSAASSLNVANK